VFVEDDDFALTPHPMKSYPRTYNKKEKKRRGKFSSTVFHVLAGKMENICLCVSGIQETYVT